MGLSRWCGALRVGSPAFDDDTPVYADPDPFPVRFKVEPIYVLEQEQSIPVFEDEIWNNLSLTRDIPKGATGWAVNFRGSLRVIAPEDGQLIMEHLARQAEEKHSYPLTDRDKRQLARRASVPSQKGQVIIEVPEEEEAGEEETGAAEAIQVTEGEPEEIRASLKVQAVLARLGGMLGLRFGSPQETARRLPHKKTLTRDCCLRSFRLTTKRPR